MTGSDRGRDAREELDIHRLLAEVLDLAEQTVKFVGPDDVEQRLRELKARAAFGTPAGLAHLDRTAGIAAESKSLTESDEEFVQTDATAAHLPTQAFDPGPGSNSNTYESVAHQAANTMWRSKTSLVGTQRLIGSRYVLEKRLGGDAVGTTWRGIDLVLGRAVAIKEIHPSLGGPDEIGDVARERTIREARATAALRHPHIVPIYDVVEGDEFPWIVMQLIDGVSLRHQVETWGPLETRRVMRIGLDLLDALEAAHAAGIVHRDVKPANVLLGEDGRVWLTDFGIAHVFGDATVTEDGIALGTPGYLAPEQARGVRAGPEADIFGLAATLYFAVEGVGPFEAETAVAALDAVVFSPPRPPVRAEGLGRALNAMVEKDPTTRATIAEARAALQSALSPRHRLAGWPTPVPIRRRPAKRRLNELARHHTLTVAISAVLAFGVAAVSFHSGPAPSQQTPRATAGPGTSVGPDGLPGTPGPAGGPRGAPPRLMSVATVTLPFPLSDGSLATARGDSLYVLDGPRLLAYNLGTGGQRWSVDRPGGTSPATLTVSRDVVAVHAASRAGALFRAADGKALWRQDGGVVGLDLLPGGLLYVQTARPDGRRHSVIGSNGGELWQVTSSGAGSVFRGATGEDYVLEWTAPGQARVHRAATGEVVSSGAADRLVGLDEDLVLAGVFVDRDGADLIGVDPLTRTEKWRVAGGHGPGTLVRCALRMACVHDPGAGRLTAVDPKSGALLWTVTNPAFRVGGYTGLDATGIDGPPIDPERVVLVRSDMAAVLDGGTGAMLYHGQGRPLLQDERHLLVLPPENQRTGISSIHLRDGRVRPLDTLPVNPSICAATMNFLACATSDRAMQIWALPPPPPPPRD